MSIIIKYALLPFSILYAIVITVRNLLFHISVLKSKSFPKAIISIGNLSVGGTGKTPHTEYLINLLNEHYIVAGLSRGYMRKTKGFRWVEATSTFDETGDEPLQMKTKFPGVSFAVDGDRVNGIQQILFQKPETDIVILDDAYQHRYVKPGLSILLTDFNKPFFTDCVLPSGRLREPRCGKNRAHIIVVTKTPANISQVQMDYFLKEINPKPWQTVFFSKIKYGNPTYIFEPIKKTLPLNTLENTKVLLVTGIANSKPLTVYLSDNHIDFTHLAFSDHYSFSNSDITTIEQKFSKINSVKKIILTTEKDATRILGFNTTIQLKNSWFFIPIEVEFLGGNETFNKKILSYVEENR